MTNLSEKKCIPCEGEISTLTYEKAEALLKNISEWQLSTDGKVISRKFEFNNFYRTLSFVNAMAWIANQENHHPDFSVGYNYCIVRYTTHAVDGLTENDFICAEKIDNLLKL